MRIIAAGGLQKRGLLCRLELAEEDGEWSEAWRGTSTAARVDDLAAGRQYSFRVAASNAVGLGAFSRPTAARTLLQPPPAPRNISVQPTQQCAPSPPALPGT